MRLSSVRRSSLFALACSLVLVACEEKKTLEPNNIEFNTLRAAKTYHLENDSTKPSCSIKMSYIYPVMMEDEAAMAKMNQEINFAMFEAHTLTFSPEKAMDEYVLNYVNYYKEEMNNLGDMWQAPEFYSFYKIIDSKIMYNEAGLVVYQIKSENYRGGTKPMTTYRNLVLNADTGDLINEADIFVDGYRSLLNRLLKDKLMAMYKVSSVDRLMDMGYTDIEDISPNANFVVDAKGITYLYSEREIAIPSLGETRIFLPFDELKDVLKADSPISILYGK